MLEFATSEGIVIAAITVPNIIQSTEKQETVSRVKKAYSVLQQASYRIAMEDGVPIGDYSLMSEDEFFDSFAKEVNTNKLCKTESGCFTDKTFKTLSGEDWAQYNRENSLITVDGVAFQWNKSSDYWACRDKGLSPEDEENCIGRFVVDINGPANPNQFGKDVFFFLAIKDKGIVPAGAATTSDCYKQGKGVTCVAKVLRDSAIDYY